MPWNLADTGKVHGMPRPAAVLLVTALAVVLAAAGCAPLRLAPLRSGPVSLTTTATTPPGQTGLVPGGTGEALSAQVTNPTDLGGPETLISATPAAAPSVIPSICPAEDLIVRPVLTGAVGIDALARWSGLSPTTSVLFPVGSVTVAADAPAACSNVAVSVQLRLVFAPNRERITITSPVAGSTITPGQPLTVSGQVAGGGDVTVTATTQDGQVEQLAAVQATWPAGTRPGPDSGADWSITVPAGAMSGWAGTVAITAASGDGGTAQELVDG